MLQDYTVWIRMWLKYLGRTQLWRPRAPGRCVGPVYGDFRRIPRIARYRSGHTNDASNFDCLVSGLN